MAEVKAAVIGAPQVKAGEALEVKFSLTNQNGSATSLSDLKEVHTKKIHALVVDPSLSDYTHAHPVAAEKAGEYKFTFTPKTDASYKIWLDITPNKGGHQYIPLQIKGTKAAAKIDRKAILAGAADGYEFKLSFDAPVKLGEAAMGTMQITKGGKPFAELQPVMGAFAHMVGFYDDYKTIAHLHPLGEEPKSEAERGGPELMFHLEPAKKGYLKLFAQVRIDGKDIYVPFGLEVK